MTPEQYARLGYPVLPCGANKAPLTSRGLKDASLTPTIPHGAQIGMVIPDGVLCLDIDDLAVLPTIMGELAAWPGPVAKTPRGGQHLFCRDPRPEGRRGNSTGNLPPGVDVRAGGKGYVIAPPGPGREWIDPLVAPPDLPDCPEHIAELLKPKAPRKAAKQAVTTIRDLNPYLQRALDLETQAVMDAPIGRGNHQLNASAYNLGQLEQHGLQRATAEGELLGAVASWGEPMPSATAIKTFASGWTAGTANPRQIPDRQSTGPVYSDMAEWSAGIPKKEVAPPGKPDGAGAGGTPRSADSMPPMGKTVNFNPPVDPRPVIVISTDEPKVNEAAISALAADPGIYSRNQRLVTILGAVPKTKTHKSLDLPVETPIVHNLCQAVVQERMAGSAQWVGFDARSQEMVPKHPPGWSVAALAGRGAWPQIRPLRGIVDYPIVRADGTVCCRPGYDPQTGYFLGNVPQLDIPDRPTQQDATFAADRLLELLVDFPIRDASTSAAWLSLLLTTIARPAIVGPTPLYVIDANTRGAGKTFLADLVGAILVGRALPAFGHTTDQAELEKILISIARLALPIVNLDNVTSSLGGGVLDRWLTSTNPAGRTLGASEVQTYDWTTILVATCNNARIHGDTDRRAIFLMLESALERPELRSDFRYPDIQGHVAAHRDAYLTAALTILRAHAVAGRPSFGGIPKGSFESWCSVVRDAAMFSGLPDCERPADDPSRPEDEDTAKLGQLLPALFHAFGERPFSVRAALLRAWPVDKMDDPDLQLQDALSSLAWKADRPTPQGLGQSLSRMSRRWINGMKLSGNIDGHTKQMLWKVEIRQPSLQELH